MQRIIELDPSGAIQGAATPKVTVGMASAPEPIVPHPDTYADFPDITSTPIDVELFDALWAMRGGRWATRQEHMPSCPPIVLSTSS